MELQQGIFTIKLYELERQHGLLQSRLQLCQGKSHERLRQEMEALADECRENDLLMQRQVTSARSPAVSALALAQTEYSGRIEAILKELPGYLCEEPDQGTGERESAALYAEYAIDFANQAMRYALLAALWAIDLQQADTEGQGKEPEHE